jgi:hypothetical protein
MQRALHLHARRAAAALPSSSLRWIGTAPPVAPAPPAGPTHTTASTEAERAWQPELHIPKGFLAAGVRCGIKKRKGAARCRRRRR